MSAVAYKSASLEERWDAIVIGSGMGGLSTAALLAKHARKRVLVLERHYAAGGYTHAFKRPGFDWDVGVHYIGNLVDKNEKVRAAFDYLSEGRLQWARMPDVFDEIRIGDRRYECHSGARKYREHLLAAFPQQARAIDRYIELITAVDDTSFPFFTEKGLPRFLAYLAGPFLRNPFLAYAKRTTADVLREISDDPEFVAVLAAQWGNYGLVPSESSFGVHALIAKHFLEGASFPVGGSAQFAESMIPTITAAGGNVVVAAEVEEILVRSGRACGVRMADGREFRAKSIVSDAGAIKTFEQLLPSSVKPPRELLEKLHAIGPSTAYLNLYVGLDASTADLGIAGANLWIHPSNDYESNGARFLSDPSGPFPMIFVSFPSSKDPDFERRHPKHATIDVVTFVPYAWFDKWEATRPGHRGAEYEEFKIMLARRLQEELEHHVPAVRGHIVHAELSTPLSTRHFAGYGHGEAYGLRATPERFAYRALRAQTFVPGLYLTGQDVVMVGVVGALFSGVITASAILTRNLIGVVTKPSRRRAITRRIAAGSAALEAAP